MALSSASLAELVAELRERLRPFMGEASGGRDPSADGSEIRSQSAGTGSPGPLGPAGRASLAARLLAVVLVDSRHRTSRELGQALERLAAALAATPVPLPGSALESGLRRLARGLEHLARNWDQEVDADLRHAWLELRAAGDGLWLPAAGAAAGKAGAVPDAAGPVPGGRPREVLWLLVAGRMRGLTLRRRLEAAGWSVACLPDPASAVARLEQEIPAAIICDDAAPARHRSRLDRLLPSASPPVITVRGRAPHPAATAAGRDDRHWLPPYRPDDLAAWIPAVGIQPTSDGTLQRLGRRRAARRCLDVAPDS